MEIWQHHPAPHPVLTEARAKLDRLDAGPPAHTLTPTTEEAPLW